MYLKLNENVLFYRPDASRSKLYNSITRYFRSLKEKSVPNRLEGENLRHEITTQRNTRGANLNFSGRDAFYLKSYHGQNYREYTMY